MFDIFFGWRKASKCKKLIRRVQCRLRLLKNKRCAIVRQLREDIAELLRHGHEQFAFDRVEHLYKDENTISIYDLLENFSEFIIINLQYIRKHKDCPNDISEAVSSLIYASARFGDLPELVIIRKLFGERYGQRFANIALQLLPGNLVNRQIKEKLCLKSVSEDVKFKLVNEIARSCLKSEPLLIEYSSEFQQHLANKSSPDQILSIEYPMNHNRDEIDQNSAISNTAETQTKILCIDSVPYSQAVIISSPIHHKEEEKVKPAFLEYKVSELEKRLTFKNINMDSSSSVSSDKLPEEMIYLDDIEEFESPVNKNGNFQDQRMFVFKSVINLPSENKKVPRKRQRKRSISREKETMMDKECEIYYNEISKISPNSKRNSHHRRKHHKKAAMEEKNIAQESRESFTFYKVNTWTMKNNSPPYIRAMTMPFERVKDTAMESILRSYSFPVQEGGSEDSNRIVHPQLPNYDELAAKFQDLKTAYLLRKE